MLRRQLREQGRVVVCSSGERWVWQQGGVARANTTSIRSGEWCREYSVSLAIATPFRHGWMKTLCTSTSSGSTYLTTPSGYVVTVGLYISYCVVCLTQFEPSVF